MAARRVGVFTGSRSEYGLLVPVLRAIEADPALELVLIAGNTHVGGDAEEFPVAAEVPIVREGEDAASTSRASTSKREPKSAGGWPWTTACTSSKATRCRPACPTARSPGSFCFMSA